MDHQEKIDRYKQDISELNTLSDEHRQAVADEMAAVEIAKLTRQKDRIAASVDVCELREIATNLTDQCIELLKGYRKQQLLTQALISTTQELVNAYTESFQELGILGD